MSQYEVIPLDASTVVDINSPGPSVGNPASLVVGEDSQEKLFLYSTATGADGAGTVFSGLVSPAAVNSTQPPTIVGDCAVGGAYHAFLWERGASTFTDLDPALSPGLPNSDALDINDQGDIVGVCFTNIGEEQSRGWFRPKNGPVVDLTKTLDPTINMATLINNGGQIMGVTLLDDETNQVFLYDPTSNELDILPAPFAIINDLNDNRVAVGGTETEAYLYDGNRKTALKIPGLPGNVLTMALGINNQGQIVGASCDSQGRYRGTLCTYQNGQFTDLHAIDDDVPDLEGWAITQGLRINDKGEIIAHAALNGVNSQVLLEPLLSSPIRPLLAAYIDILYGVINDAPGAGIVNGHLVHPEPSGPNPWALLGASERDVLLGLGINGLAKGMTNSLARAEIQRAASKIVQEAAGRLAGPALGLRAAGRATPRPVRFARGRTARYLKGPQSR